MELSQTERTSQATANQAAANRARAATAAAAEARRQGIMQNLARSYSSGNNLGGTALTSLSSLGGDAQGGLAELSAASPRPALEKTDSAESAKGKVRRLSLQVGMIEDLERANKAARRRATTGARASCMSVAARSSVGGRSSVDALAAASMESSVADTISESRRTEEDEPPINSKEDLKVWIKWAKAEAIDNLNNEHPRITVKEVERKKAPIWAMNNRSSARFSSADLEAAAARRSDSEEGDEEAEGGASPTGRNSATEGRSSTRKQRAARFLGRMSGRESASGPPAEEVSSSIKVVKVPLCSDPDDLSRALGVGVRLYFDVLKLFLGFSLLGVLCSAPSFYASIANVADGAYASEDPVTSLSFPGFFAIATLGSRARELDPAATPEDGCVTEQCIQLNTLTAILEVLYSILFFLCVRKFVKYAKTLAYLDQEENVRVEDYTIQLFGLDWLTEADVTTRSMQKFVEHALKSHGMAKKARYIAKRDKALAKGREYWHKYYAAMVLKWEQFLGEKPFPDDAEGAPLVPGYKVFDITLIVQDNGLLRKLVKLAPAEAKVPTLERKVMIAEAVGESAWGIKGRQRKLDKALKALEKKRASANKLAQKAFGPIGAFVTFEREVAKQVALDLWKPRSWLNRLSCGLCQRHPGYAYFPVPSSLREDGSYNGYRLKAYPAPRPMNVQYENLHAKFSMSTHLRRGCANLIVVVIILLGMVVTASAAAVQSSAHYFADLLFADQLASAFNISTQDAFANISSGASLSMLGAANATNVTRSFFTCTAEQEAYLNDNLWSDVIGTVARLADQSDSIHKGTGLLLLSALLSCYLVPLFNVLFTFLIVIFNSLIALAIRGLVGFRRYDSRTDMHATSVKGLSTALFLNTGLVLLAVHTSTGPIAKIAGNVQSKYGCWAPDDPTLGCLVGPNGFLLRGNHFDLGPSWYSEVGASLCFTLILTIFLRPMMPFVYWVMHRLKICCVAGKKRHVEAMKALYVGPVPLLADLLGKVYAFAALCVTFSTLLPMLHVFMALYISVVFLVDKWYLLRVCQKTVPYGATFITHTLGWVQYALIAKLTLAVWAFGSIPGSMLSSSLLSFQGSLTGAGLSSSADLVTSLDGWLASLGTTWWSQRIATVGSVALVIGLFGLTAIVFLSMIYRAASRFIGGFYNAVCTKKEEKTQQVWPVQLPQFSQVLDGGAVSHRVKIFAHADELGRGEKLALREDIDESLFAGCYGPLSILLYCFGIQTLRPHIKQADWDKMPEKKNAIIGKENMSYSPHFMPEYANAFAYTNTTAGERNRYGSSGAPGSRNRGSTASASRAVSNVSLSTVSDESEPSTGRPGGYI